jgi:hypothetical protein
LRDLAEWRAGIRAPRVKLTTKSEVESLTGPVGGIYAKCVLQKFLRREVGPMLIRMTDALVAGARILVSAPDFTWLCAEHLKPSDESAQIDPQSYILGTQSSEEEFNYSFLNQASVVDAFKDLGLVDIECGFGPFGPAHAPMCMMVSGRKPCSD